MAATVILALLAVPPPVTNASGARLSDGTVSLNWSLPVDPSVAGVTVVREPMDGTGSQMFVLSGAPTALHDTSVFTGVSYRYVIYAHDWSGFWSAGATVIITYHDVDEDGEVHFFCASSAGLPAAPVALLLAAAAALAVTVRRRPRRPAPCA